MQAMSTEFITQHAIPNHLVNHGGVQSRLDVTSRSSPCRDLGTIGPRIWRRSPIYMSCGASRSSPSSSPTKHAGLAQVPPVSIGRFGTVPRTKHSGTSPRRVVGLVELSLTLARSMELKVVRWRTGTPNWQHGIYRGGLRFLDRS
jgi:hypothetical protein